MAKRDSKGRFLKRRRGTRGIRGLGTIITMRRGMGALPGGPIVQNVIPPAVGGLVTALVALAVRHFGDPNASSTQRMLVRYAWLVGMGGGVVASLALMLLGGAAPAVSSAVASLAVGAGFFGQDQILARNAGSIAAALTDTPAGVSRLGRNRGVRAIVPEYANGGGMRGGMGAMVMEPVGPSGHRAGTLGAAPYGANIALRGMRGINDGAFGTRAFRS